MQTDQRRPCANESNEVLIEAIDSAIDQLPDDAAFDPVFRRTYYLLVLARAAITGDLEQHYEVWYGLMEDFRDENWTEIGVVGVDSGRIFISDPCNTCQAKTDSNEQQFKQYYSDPKMLPTSVSIRTRNGDGNYPVEARLTEDGRPAEIRIRMSI